MDFRLLFLSYVSRYSWVQTWTCTSVGKPRGNERIAANGRFKKVSLVGGLGGDRGRQGGADRGSHCQDG